MMNVNTDAVASEKALRKRKITNAIVMILLIIVLFIFIFPFLMVIINVFKQKSDIMRDPLALIGSKGFTLENFPNAMAKMGFWGAFFNSLIITVSSTVLTIIFSSMAASPESQDHPDPYAYGLRNVHGGLYVPRGYPYKYPD